MPLLCFALAMPYASAEENVPEEDVSDVDVHDVPVHDALETRIFASVGGFFSTRSFNVTVEVDLGARKITLKVDGKEVSSPLRKDWDRIRAYGYMANNAHTSFSPIEVSGE